MRLASFALIILVSAVVSKPILAAEPSKDQTDQVFSFINEADGVISLTQQEKSETGSAWLYYKDNPFIGSPGTTIKKVYIPNCKLGTVTFALGFNKTYVGCTK